MGWAQDLCVTYDRCSKLAGVRSPDGSILMPLSHLQLKVQITITIDIDGNFIRAERNDPEDQDTIIPVTIDSASRSSGITPMPLEDKLLYVAGDYSTEIGDNKKAEACHDAYMKQLREWADEPDAPIQLKAIRNYLEKGTMIRDIRKNGAFEKNDDFVRFRVRRKETGYTEETWLDGEMYEAFSRYYSNEVTDKDIDYITGEEMETTSKLPAKLRNSGDKAKIISSNDTSGYTFRGRFKTAEEAACIGYVSSQKTFNALRWLVNKQGYRNGSEQIVCWKADGDEPIPILAGSSEIFGDADELVEFNNTDTAERYAAKVRKAIAGYRADISDSEGITVMAIDTADGSNQGRLSITYYQHMTGSDLINNIEKWHRDCSWEIRYVKDRVSGKYLDFIGAPSPVDIARAAYGTGREGLLEADDKVQKKCIDRILPCIVQGKNIPKDIVRAAVFNAGEPERFTSYNWMKIMEIACALIRKQTIETYGDKRGDELMSLDVESRDRSYLFGRLLAIMKRAEEYANYKSGEDRTTSAEKYWNVFSRKPAKTVAILQEKLMPYFARMNPGTRNYYSLQIEDVMNALEEVSGFNNEHLTEQYLIGYYNQYASMRKKADENNDNDSETQEDK